MRIESILLENIRSHVRTLVDFSDGFNCLVGGIGAGKSSVLYAIDFALFGEPLGRSYEYLLREEGDFGRIALKFQSNGREYTILRGLKRQTGGISQDAEQLKLFEGERLIAEMKGDAVEEQLRSIIAIDRDIFREIVWVRQEHLKDILDMPPRARQGRLDQLFGLSDYETSWTNLRPVLGAYENEKSFLERDADISGIADLQAKYEDTASSLAKKGDALEEAKKNFEKAEIKLREVVTNLEMLESLHRRNTELQEEENELQLGIRSRGDQSGRLAEEIQTRKNGIKNLEERFGALENQIGERRRKLGEVGLPQDLAVENMEEHAEGLVEQVSSLQGECENVRTEIKKISQRVSSLLRESKCPLCLQILSPAYKENMMNHLYKETSEHKKRLDSLQISLNEVERSRSILKASVSDIRILQTRMEETGKQIERERNMLENAESRLCENQKEEKTLLGRLSELRMEKKDVDVSQLEEAQQQYKTAFEQYSGSKYEVLSAESQKNDVFNRLENLKGRLDIAQNKIERLEKIKKIADLTQEIRQSYRSIQPKLRSEFVKYLARVVQQVLNELGGDEGSTINLRIDENYTPILEVEGGQERNVLNLSGGERTLLAFAYRIGVGQLIMQWRAGHGLRMLLLDEPTESLGREDGSIDRLAESISRLKTVEQVIAVTHSEAFAEKADHVIRLEKSNNKSAITIEP